MSSIGRVTSGQLYVNAQSSMAQVKSRLAVLQQQATDGLAITKPSDDPAGTAQVLRLHGDIATNGQYKTNIDDGLSWLGTIDTALGHADDDVRTAKDQVIQASNLATSTPISREAAAKALEGIKADLLTQANTKYLGRSVFAGTSDAAQAFAADGTFNGAVTSGDGSVQRRISATETVTVSASGAAAFGTKGTGGAQGTSVFETLDRIIGALRDPAFATDATVQAKVTNGIDDLEDARTALSGQRGIEGANYSRITAAKSANADLATNLEKQRSSIEDVDTAKVILDLKTQELAYQTSLAVTAQVLQPTLMSFLQ